MKITGLKMFNIKNICIIGAGNIGIAAAVDISQNESYSVTLLSSHANNLSNIFTKIDPLNDEKIVSKKINVTDDYNIALSNSDLVIVAIPSFLIKDVLSRVAEYKNIKMILFLPGYGGGKEFYCNRLRERGCLIAGVDRSPYVARLIDKYTVKASTKQHIRIAVLKNKPTEELCKFIESLFAVPCGVISNYLAVTFTPSNPILHTSRLYSLFKDADFDTCFSRMIKFYSEWDDFASKILFEMDEELKKLCNSFPNIDLSDVILNSVYYESETPQLLTKKITSIQSLSSIDAPMVKKENTYFIDGDSRYFKEDFMCGLSNLKCFAVIAGIKTPYIDTVLMWYGKISGVSFFDDEQNFIYNDVLGCPQNFGLYSISDIECFYQNE